MGSPSMSAHDGFAAMEGDCLDECMERLSNGLSVADSGPNRWVCSFRDASAGRRPGRGVGSNKFLALDAGMLRTCEVDELEGSRREAYGSSELNSANGHPPP